jgi:hypothetical protein
MTIGSEGNVYNPYTTGVPDSTQTPPNLGRQGEALNSDVHGKFATAGNRKALFSFNVTAVTIPVVASGLVSVASLWNPPSSGVMVELVDTELGQVLATTVVDTVGWYMSTGNLALAGTFTTRGVGNTNYFSGRVGDFPAGQAIPYSAYTHSGTPVRVDIIGAFGAVTDASMTLTEKFYDGRLLVPPGSVISVAMSTAAGFTSGLDVGFRWMEYVFQN